MTADHLVLLEVFRQWVLALNAVYFGLVVVVLWRYLPEALHRDGRNRDVAIHVVLLAVSVSFILVGSAWTRIQRIQHDLPFTWTGATTAVGCVAGIVGLWWMLRHLRGS